MGIDGQADISSTWSYRQSVGIRLLKTPSAATDQSHRNRQSRYLESLVIVKTLSSPSSPPGHAKNLPLSPAHLYGYIFCIRSNPVDMQLQGLLYNFASDKQSLTLQLDFDFTSARHPKDPKRLRTPSGTISPTTWFSFSHSLFIYITHIVNAQ